MSISGMSTSGWYAGTTGPPRPRRSAGSSASAVRPGSAMSTNTVRSSAAAVRSDRSPASKRWRNGVATRRCQTAWAHCGRPPVRGTTTSASVAARCRDQPGDEVGIGVEEVAGQDDDDRFGAHVEERGDHSSQGTGAGPAVGHAVKA